MSNAEPWRERAEARIQAEFAQQNFKIIELQERLVDAGAVIKTAHATINEQAGQIAKLEAELAAARAGGEPAQAEGVGSAQALKAA